MTENEIEALLSDKKLLIFDFDGTIADSSPLHARAFNDTFATEGVRIDYGPIAGLTTEDAIDRIASEHGLQLSGERRQQLVEDKRLRARELIRRELAAFPRSIQFIERARSRFRLALCSSASRSTLEAALFRLQIAEFFDPIVTGEDVTRGKPDPEGLNKILGLCGIPAALALVLEDADSGIAAAERAGIRAIRIAPDSVRPGVVNWHLLNSALGRFEP